MNCASSKAPAGGLRRPAQFIEEMSGRAFPATYPLGCYSELYAHAVAKLFRTPSTQRGFNLPPKAIVHEPVSGVVALAASCAFALLSCRLCAAAALVNADTAGCPAVFFLVLFFFDLLVFLVFIFAMASPL
jgi:hypothetical protein